jgi:hypothetical protein
MPCAMLNDLHVGERHTPRPRPRQRRRPGKTRYRDFLGVKWSQIQILSARPESLQVSSDDLPVAHDAKRTD